MFSYYPPCRAVSSGVSEGGRKLTNSKYGWGLGRQCLASVQDLSVGTERGKLSKYVLVDGSYKPSMASLCGVTSCSWPRKRSQNQKQARQVTENEMKK